MSLFVNGKPLRRITLNGLELSQDVNEIKSINFHNFDNGSFTITNKKNVVYTYHVDFDGDGNPIRIYDTYSSITITW